MSEDGASPAAAGVSRNEAIGDLLRRAGFAGARYAYLDADASFRRYARISGGPRPALLMDAPPDKEDIGPWLAVSRHLRGFGFSAPDVFAADERAGLAVIEDFGDDTFTRVLAEGGDEAALYDLAVDVLAALHGIAPADAAPPWIPAYDDVRLLEEAALFTDWYMPAVLGMPTPPDLRTAYLGLWREALPAARDVPETLVLRDYHVDNLMRIPGRSGIAACGLLDFQDAVRGPVAYDVVSLIADARRDLGPGIGERARARYFAQCPALDRDAFDTAAAVLSAGRNAKIIGIFTRLWKRDGKPVYLTHIPRVWRLLERDLAHPALAALKAWFDDAVPQNRREVPGGQGGRT
ncbi:MAG: phosphotransferase [Alphaproteobacteria bacterium]|nr:phosphotransferase [Alphaproteobacteria bacterium]